MLTYDLLRIDRATGLFTDTLVQFNRFSEADETARKMVDSLHTINVFSVDFESKSLIDGVAYWLDKDGCLSSEAIEL